MQLEKEVEELSFQHENRIRALKTQFLKEKKAYEESATTRVKDMAEQASKVSHQFRTKFAVRILHGLASSSACRLNKSVLERYSVGIGK